MLVQTVVVLGRFLYVRGKVKGGEDNWNKKELTTKSIININHWSGGKNQ